MKYLIITGNPKQEGLCDSITKAVQKGAADGNADVAIFCASGLQACRSCGNGWGICKSEHRCEFADSLFNEGQQKVREADLLCLISPVYWGETAEGLKSFFDKLRRCEYGASGALSGKPVLLVASPGGSGNGMLSCLEQMDRFCRHTGAVIFDYIGVNRWNQDYKRAAAYAAAKAMAEGRRVGETL